MLVPLNGVNEEKRLPKLQELFFSSVGAGVSDACADDRSGIAGLPLKYRAIFRVPSLMSSACCLRLACNCSSDMSASVVIESLNHVEICPRYEESTG